MHRRWGIFRPPETAYLPGLRSQRPLFAATGIFCHPANAANLSCTVDDVGTLHSGHSGVGVVTFDLILRWNGASRPVFLHRICVPSPDSLRCSAKKTPVWCCDLKSPEFPGKAVEGKSQKLVRRCLLQCCPGFGSSSFRLSVCRSHPGIFSS
jgi:hypothetical protein